MFHDRPHRSLVRSRWAALGAAVAVTIGGGGLVGVSAAGGDASGTVFTGISPVRMLDTRGGSMVGALDGSGAPLRLQVTGDRVPAGAEAVSMNVTVVEGRTSAFGGYVTVYPCDIARPNTSNLNFVHGQTVPNAVTVPLAGDGSVCFYVYGRAHLLADVMGYHGDTRIAAIEAELGQLRSLSAADDDSPPVTVDLTGYATRTETDTMISTAIDTAIDTAADDLRTELARSIPDPIDLTGYATRTETDTMISTAIDTAVSRSTAAPAPAHGRVVDAVGQVHHQIQAWTDGGHDAAITIGLDGRAVIAHHDRATGSVLVTRCDDPLCTTARSAIAHTNGGAAGLDLAIGYDGMPVVAFASGGADTRLVTAVCAEPSCTTRTVRTHDTGTGSGVDPSMVIGVDGSPIVAHITGGRLAITRCLTPACSGVADTTIGVDATAAEPTITVRPDGIPEIAVTSAAGLRLVTCADPACTTVAADRIIAGPIGGHEPTIAVDTTGRLLIAHRAFDTDGLGDLLLTVCADIACTSATTVHVDGDDDGHSVGWSASLVIGVDGAPRIAHIHRRADGSSRLRITTIGTDLSGNSADTHITAHAVAATLDADAALVGALTVDTGATSTLALHRRVHRSWTANGWGD